MPRLAAALSNFIMPSTSRSLLVVAAFLASCAAYVEQRLEAAIVEALPQLLGPADRYEVGVRGVDAQGSHIEAVRAVGTRIQRPRSPVLDRIEVELLDVAFDRSAKRVTAVGTATATLRLRADDLTAYLAKQRWIERPSVRLVAPAGIVVAARLQLPGLELPTAFSVEFRGRLIAAESKLLLAVDGLDLGDRAAPWLARGLIERAINPLFDLAPHALPARIDSVEVDGDALAVHASGSRITLRRDARRDALRALPPF